MNEKSETEQKATFAEQYVLNRAQACSAPLDGSMVADEALRAWEIIKAGCVPEQAK